MACAAASSQTVATDHAPFDFKTQKPMGRDDFTKIPNGIPSLEDRVNLLYTHGVKRGRIDLHTFVDIASTNAAKIFGLFPRKGAIQSAPMPTWSSTIPTYRGTISAKTQQMNVDYSAFEGLEIEGRPTRRDRARRSRGARRKVCRTNRPRKIPRARAESFLGREEASGIPPGG